MAYAGSFVAPAVIGTVATVTHLTVALPLPAVLVMALALFAGQLARTRSAR